MGAATLLESRIRDVLVFRQDAVVTREALLVSPPWPEQVEIVGLPLALEDGSLRARVVAANDPGQDRQPQNLPQPTDVRVELAIPPLGTPVEAPSETELRQARVAVNWLEQQIGRLDDENSLFDRISLSLPERLEDEPPRAISATAYTSTAHWVQRGKQARVDEKCTLRRQLQEAREQLARLERQAREAKAERGVDEEAVSKRALITLRPGPAGASAKLLIEYRVPGARWRPSYVLRVARDGQRASLAVRALVAQHSGEPWERVRLAVSTADLQRAVKLPELLSIRIGRSQPEQPKRAWREPPSGADALFESLDAALETMPAPAAMVTRAGVPSGMPQQLARSSPRSSAQPAKDKSARKRDDPAPIADDIAEELEESGAVFASAADVDYELAAEPEAAAAPMRQAVLSKKEMKRARAPGRAAGRGEPPPAPPPPPAAAPAPAMAMRSMAAPMEAASMAPAANKSMAADYEVYAQADGAALGGGGYPAEYETPSGAVESEVLAQHMIVRETVVEYGELRLTSWDSGAGARGRLRRPIIRNEFGGLSGAIVAKLEQRLGKMVRLARAIDRFPENTYDVAAAAGSFDYRYDAAAAVDVPNDGKVHSVPLFAREAAVALTLVVVPRESDQAVRVATMKNPLQAPVLAGPAEIYLGDEFLVTSQLQTVPSGAELNVGLGIEPALKVARNTRFREETQGLLSGQLALQHEVDIDLASRLAAPVELEVRERIPVKIADDKEVTVQPGKPVPPWEEWKQTADQALRGGRRWRLTLAPGESKQIKYTYTIQIDSKNELVGGNRRE